MVSGEDWLLGEKWCFKHVLNKLVVQEEFTDSMRVESAKLKNILESKVLVLTEASK